MPYFIGLSSEIERGVVRAAGEGCDLFLEIRAVEFLGVGQRPGLALEAPRLRLERLRALEQGHSRLRMAGLVEVLGEAEGRGRQRVLGGRQRQPPAPLLRGEGVLALRA